MLNGTLSVHPKEKRELDGSVICESAPIFKVRGEALVLLEGREENSVEGILVVDVSVFVANCHPCVRSMGGEEDYDRPRCPLPRIGIRRLAIVVNNMNSVSC